MKRRINCLTLAIMLTGIVPGAFADDTSAPGCIQHGEEPERLFIEVEEMASFDGNLLSWLAANLRYPEDAAEKKIQGKVIVQFVVEEDGSISNVTVLRGLDSSLDIEAVRVVKSMPRWNPGKREGKPVRVRYVLPVIFRL